jgi:large subunit ribosomal protein L18
MTSDKFAMYHERYLSRQKLRRRRHVRKSVRGTADRPRLTVFRSLQHIYCQVVDDTSGKTLAAASTKDKDLRGSVKYGGNAEAAKAIGTAIAQRAQAAGVKQVCFDRGHFKYHGRVAALADAARAGGLEF